MVLFHGGLRTMCLHGTIDVTRTYYSERPSAWSMMSLLWWQARWCWRTGNCFVSTRHNASLRFVELCQSNKGYLASSISKFVLWYLIFPLIILILLLIGNEKIETNFKNKALVRKPPPKINSSKSSPPNHLCEDLVFCCLLFIVYCLLFIDS